MGIKVYSNVATVFDASLICFTSTVVFDLTCKKHTDKTKEKQTRKDIDGILNHDESSNLTETRANK